MLSLRGSGQVYLTAAFAPDGRWFAAGGLGHAVEVWDTAAPDAVAWEVDTDGVAVSFVGFTPDGRLVVTRAKSALHLVPPVGDVITCWLLPDHVQRAALAAGGARLVTAGTRVTTWELGDEFREVSEVTCGAGEVLTGVAVSPDGRLVASGRVAADGTAGVEILDATTGTFLHLLPVAGTRADKLAWSPDGRLLAGLVDLNLTVWETAGWAEVLSPLDAAEPGDGVAVAFHPTGNLLLTGTTRGAVSLLDTHGWATVTTYRWKLGPVYALAVAADGLRAAAAGHRGPVLWDLDV